MHASRRRCTFAPARDNSEATQIHRPITTAPCLLWCVGEQPGRRIALGSTPLFIGRKGTPPDLAINDQKVSSQHCSLSYIAANAQFEIKDLGSTNGTFLMPSNQRLDANVAVRVNPNQVIRLGPNQEFVLLVE